MDWIQTLIYQPSAFQGSAPAGNRIPFLKYLFNIKPDNRSYKVKPDNKFED